MDLYSTSLALALAAVAVAALVSLSAWLAERRDRRERSDARGRLAALAALGGLALVALSLLVHLFAGHRPGTAGAMSVAGFVLEHPAPFGAALVAAVLLARRRRIGG